MSAASIQATASRVSWLTPVMPLPTITSRPEWSLSMRALSVHGRTRTDPFGLQTNHVCNCCAAQLGPTKIRTSDEFIWSVWPPQSRLGHLPGGSPMVDQERVISLVRTIAADPALRVRLSEADESQRGADPDRAGLRRRHAQRRGEQRPAVRAPCGHSGRGDRRSPVGECCRGGGDTITTTTTTTTVTAAASAAVAT